MRAALLRYSRIDKHHLPVNTRGVAGCSCSKTGQFRINRTIVMRIIVFRSQRHGFLLLTFLLAPSVTFVNALQLVSVPDPSVSAPAGGGGDSTSPILSPDARFVLFSSTANNLVVTSSNTPYLSSSFPRVNVFLRDRTDGTTTLVSVNATGNATGNGDSMGTAVSTNGQFALFESSASDLVPDDTNQINDVFVRDLIAGTTHLVSIATNGGAANGESRDSSMTPDGRFVALASAANNLVTDDTNGITDVFVADLRSNTMTLVSIGAMGLNTNSASSAPDISSDGRYVAFYSTATNVVLGTTNSGRLYVRDLVAGITYHVDTNADFSSHLISDDGKYLVFEVRKTNTSSGTVFRYRVDTGLFDVVNTNCYVPDSANYDDSRRIDITPDGRFITFLATSNNTSGPAWVGVWDAQSGLTTSATASIPANGTPFCGWPTIDPAGRYLAFIISYGSNFFTNRQSIYPYFLHVRDMQLGTNWLVNVKSNGIWSNVSFTSLSRSAANGAVAFQAPDGNLVADDRNQYEDVFIGNLATRTTELISARQPALPSLTPSASSGNSTFSMSADGRYVAFASDGSDLTLNDTNKIQDLFRRDRLVGTNHLISVGNLPISATSLQFTNGSTEPSINADGRYVAYVAYPFGGTSAAYPRNVLLRDTFTGSNKVIGVTSTGLELGVGPCYAPMISADGSNVLFRSTSPSIAPGVSGENLFYRNLQYNTNRALTTYAVVSADMTADGRRVAFVGSTSSGNTNLYVWDSQATARVYTNSTPGISRVAISPDGSRIAYATATQLFLADWSANTNWLVGSMTFSPRVGMRFSTDGQWLAFACTNAVAPADTNGTYDVYLHEIQTGTNILVSHAFNSDSAGNDASDSPDISPDGRLVVYRSDASDLVSSDNNGAGDVFLFDRWTGVTKLLSVNKTGGSSANGLSASPQFTRDGHTVFFKTWATDMTEGDFNGGSDLFAYAVFYVSIARDGLPASGPTLSWPVAPGKAYHAQFLDDLNSTNWQDAGGAITIIGDLAYYTDPVPTAGQRYYRIVAD
jgi:hypothetical protein